MRDLKSLQLNQTCEELLKYNFTLISYSHLQLCTYFVQYAHYHACCTSRLDHFHLFDDFSFDSLHGLSLICRTCRADTDCISHSVVRAIMETSIHAFSIFAQGCVTRVRVSGQGNDVRLLIRIIIWPKIKHQIAPSRESGPQLTLKHLHRNLSSD